MTIRRLADLPIAAKSMIALLLMPVTGLGASLYGASRLIENDAI